MATKGNANDIEWPTMELENLGRPRRMRPLGVSHTGGKRTERPGDEQAQEPGDRKIDGKLTAGERIRRRGESDAKDEERQRENGRRSSALCLGRRPDADEWQRVRGTARVRHVYKIPGLTT